MAIDISGLLSGGSQLAAAYLPYQASQEASDALSNMANRFILNLHLLVRLVLKQPPLNPSASLLPLALPM